MRSAGGVERDDAMRTVRRAPLPWFASALACLLASPVLAGTADAADDEGWVFSLAPYGWLVSLSGEVGADGDAADVDLPFRDILEDLNFGFMGVAEARRGRWFGALDVLVSELRSDARFGPTRAEADLDQWLTKLGVFGGYRALSHPLGAGDDPRRLTVDGYGGGRLWYVDTDIELDSPILGTRRISDDTWWIDPVIGLRVRGDVTDRFTLSAVGDLGGFGIGSASKFTWGLQGTLSYRLTDRWVLSGGYRVIGLDREKGSAGFDGELHGPLVGAVYSWGSSTR